jgi:HK97 family phage major capsid protein/HK97 family phage prohead protease
MKTDNDLIVYRATSDAQINDTDNGRTLTGHFSVFENSYEISSWVEGDFVETIAPGAFEKTFRERGSKIRLLYEHGYDMRVGDRPLGKPTVLREDIKGAYIEAELFDVEYVTELLPAIRSGVMGMSFGFRVMADSWVEEPGISATNPHGLPERTITEVDVREVTVTLWPANDATDVGVRSITDRFNKDLAEEIRSSKQASEQISNEEDSKAETPVNDTESDKVVVPAESEETRNTSNDNPIKKVSSPMRIEERRARLEEIRAEKETFEIDNLSDEDEVKFSALEEEERSHQVVIDKFEERRKTVADNAKSGNVERHGQAPAVHTNTKAVHDVDELRKDAYNGEHYRSLVAQNARRVVDEADFSGSGNEQRAKAQIVDMAARDDDFGRRVAHTSGDDYRSAYTKWVGKQYMSPEEQRAMALGSDPAGGYGVPFELDPTIIWTADTAINPLRSLARVERITGKTIQLTLGDQVTVTRDTPFPGEAVPVTDGSPTLSRSEFRPGRVSAFLPRSIEIDAAYSTLDSQLTRALMEAKDVEEAETFVTGTGDGMTGVEGLNQLAVLLPSAVTEAAPSWDAIFELDNDLPNRYRPNARWVGNNTTFNAIRLIDENVGGDLWTTRQGANPAQVNGKDMHELSTLDGPDGSNPYLIYGDFRNYLIVDRIGMVMKRVDVVTVTGSGAGVVNRPNGQEALVAYWWNGGGYIVPNAFRALAGAGS